MVRAWSREQARAARRFSRGDELFGQLLIPPLGSAGTYAEYVAGHPPRKPPAMTQEKATWSLVRWYHDHVEGGPWRGSRSEGRRKAESVPSVGKRQFESAGKPMLTMAAADRSSAIPMVTR